ncbi:MAG: alkaline phosphatase family protein [Nannocystaceae bacterium]|nr:alkaline phosphatase family protein [Myxococcales bacterium]
MLTLVAALWLGCAPSPATLAPGPAPPSPPVAAAPRPALVVLVVVDQMRASYLERFADAWPKDQGMHRLLDRGVRFDHAVIEHAWTNTGPGHATLVTGVHPSRHGVVLNHWYEPTLGREITLAEDPQVALVGTPAIAGAPGRSPFQLEREAVGDWLKAQSPESQVLTIAAKPRASIMMGGKRPDDAYWYEPDAGALASSTYYAATGAVIESPAILEAGLLGGWRPIAQPEVYKALAGPDRVDSEAEGAASVFPYRFVRDPGKVTVREREAYNRRVRFTPFTDALTLEFALDELERRGLGADEHPDLLLLGFSAGDYIGHAFGPDSHELVDYFLRLDGFIGRLLERLDEQVGRDRYALVLTSDHGVMSMPEILRARGQGLQRQAFRWLADDYRAAVSEAVLTVLSQMGLPPTGLRHVNGYGVWLDPSLAKLHGIDRRVLLDVVARAVRALPHVEDVFTATELDPDEQGGLHNARPWIIEYRRSFFRGRSPDLAIRFGPWVLADAEARGTDHGSPYMHDAHIPLVIVRPGVPAGVVGERVSMVDVAPTLAALLGIRAPADLDGQSLLERPVTR